jgi:hypothetical protein
MSQEAHVTPGPRLRSCPVVCVSKMGEAHVTGHMSHVTHQKQHVTCLHTNVLVTRMERTLGSMNMPRRPGIIHCVTCDV